MQTVSSAPNTDFVVEPLQTVATSIISRTKTRIPVDNPGTYGHGGRGSRRTNRFYITFGNNDAGFNPENAFLEMDITCTWLDPDESEGHPNTVSCLAPNFDQSVSSLIRTLRVRLPNGTVLETFDAYNEFANIMQSCLQTAYKKEHDLLNYSAFCKDVHKDNGTNPVLDGYWNKTLSTNGIQNGQTRRLMIPLKHISWFNKERFIPLFLFRNGLQLEIELEDPNVAFVFDSISSVPRGKFYPAISSGHTLAGADTFHYNWMIGMGSILMDGTAVAPAAVPAADDETIGGVWGVPEVWTTNYPGADAAVPYNDIFSRYKNMLLLDPQTFGDLFRSLFRDAIEGDTETAASILARFPVGSAMGVPVTITRHGVLLYRGFIAWMINGSDLTFSSVDANPNNVFVDPHNAASATIGWRFLTDATTYDRVDGAVATTQVLAAMQGMLSFPLYNWDHLESGRPYGTNTIPAAVFMDTGDLETFLEHIPVQQLELGIDYDHYFIFNVDGSTAHSHYFSPATYSADPRVAALTSWSRSGVNPFKWDYKVENISLVLDWIKPSSDIMSNYVRSFGNSTGIPYLIPRVQRVARDFPTGTTGSQQIVLPVSVRSLYMVLIVIKDPYFETYGQSNTIMYLPALSSFLRRGLESAEIVVGGTRKPEYTLTMDRDGGMEHIPETSNAFGTSVTRGLDPAFKRLALAAIRNYACAGSFDLNADTLTRRWEGRQTPTEAYPGTGYATPIYGLEYSDASNFIMAISLSRKDAGNFLCGMDTSMSGTLTANLVFNRDQAPTVDGTSFDPGAGLGRGLRVVFYAFSHGVGTISSQVTTYRN